MKKIYIQISIFIIIIVIFYFLNFFNIVNSIFLPYPHTVVMTLFKILFESNTYNDVFSTLLRTILGFSLASLVGIPVGLIIGYFKKIGDAFIPIIDFLRSIPSTALIPLFIIFIGITNFSKIVLVAFSTFLIITTYTFLGVRNTDQNRVLFAKTLGISKIQLFIKIIFFESLPSIFIGLRTSISLALVLVIVAEMIMGSNNGLGTRIYLARYGTDYPKMYSLIVLCGFIGYLFNFIFKIINDKIVHWVGKNS